MLSFKNVHIKVKKRTLFSIEELELSRGLVALMGRNGAGKSTFIRAVMGESNNFDGDILLANKNILDFQTAEKAKRLSVVATKPFLFGNHTAREVLYLGRLPYQNFLAKIGQVDREKVDEIIGLLKITDFADRIFVELSDGEKQLVMIGRALVQDTPIVLLDEPSAFLDIVNRHMLMKLLRNVVDATGKLIIFSTHQTEQLDHICDEVLLISDQQLVRLTDPAQFKSNIHKSFGLNEI
jgi:iron complex transport system ATP-binding protein